MYSEIQTTRKSRNLYTIGERIERLPLTREMWLIMGLVGVAWLAAIAASLVLVVFCELIFGEKKKKIIAS